MIICAALKIQVEGLDHETVLPCVRHSDGFKILEDLAYFPKTGYKVLEQGFITHDKKFLNRKEAFEHASEIGQLSSALIRYTYLVCAFIYYFVRDRLNILIPIWGFFVLWCMLRCNFIPSGKPILNLPANHALYAFAGAIHIDTGAHCALTMGGVILSVADVKSRTLSGKSRGLIALGLTAMLAILGVVSNQFWIVNKIQATIPWVFYSSAAAVGTYALISWAVQYNKEKWFNIIKAAGTATLTCYLVPNIWYCLLSLLDIGTKRPEWCNSGIPGILTCVAFSLLCVWTTHLLGKVNIKLKV